MCSSNEKTVSTETIYERVARAVNLTFAFSRHDPAVLEHHMFILTRYLVHEFAQHNKQFDKAAFVRLCYKCSSFDSSKVIIND